MGCDFSGLPSVLVVLPFTVPDFSFDLPEVPAVPAARGIATFNGTLAVPALPIAIDALALLLPPILSRELPMPPELSVPRCPLP